MEEIKQYLSRLPFWDKLSEQEQEKLIKSTFIKTYEKGQIVHNCNTDCLGMILVIEGEIRTCIMSEEGREITLFRLHDGDSCILSASCVISQITFETQMVAQRESRLLVIRPGAFLALTEQNIHARCYMYEMATESFSDVMWSLQQILFKGFDRRLAGFLLEEYERTGAAEIKMTHEQIAQHTSSAREVVARMLKRFATDGLVEVKRGEIKLLDISALRDIT